MATTPGLTVRLPSSTPEEFLQRSGPTISRGGIFLASPWPRAPGTALVLELLLQGGARLLLAQAVVAWVTGLRGEGVRGMGLQFVAVDAAGRRFLESAAAVMPHARSKSPPVPAGVGTPDVRRELVWGTSPVRGGALARPSPAGVSAPVQPGPPPPFVPRTLGPRAGPIIGIDLGTTNSCGAVVRSPGQPAELVRRAGQALVPSVVSLSAKGELVVGAPARGQLLANPLGTAWGFKRLLGRPTDGPEVEVARARFPWAVVPSDQGECAALLGEGRYRLEELSALVLAEVKGLAENHLGLPVHRAVITVPAWYTEPQRQAVREAGRLAGLHVERLVSEPTAAALAWSATHQRPGRVLVYDLGGGTFDASVLELENGVHEVVATGGEPFLGGMDFDAAVVEWALDQFEQHYGERPSERVALQRLLDAAERAKVALSEKAEVRLLVPFVSVVGQQPVDLDLTLTRPQLEALTRPLVDHTLEVCQQVLASRSLRPDQLDEVILVGGQSRAPLVREALTAFFGKAPVSGDEPEAQVALGAALLADSLASQSGVVLLDVLPHSIGVALPGGQFHVVIPRHTPLPAKRTYSVATTRDRQDRLELTVLQGESPRARDNAWLGRFVVEGLPPAPRGGLTVELSFELSQECLLTLKATDSVTGREVRSAFATRDTPAEVRQRLAAAAPAAPQDPLRTSWVRRLFGSGEPS